VVFNRGNWVVPNRGNRAGNFIASFATCDINTALPEEYRSYPDWHFDRGKFSRIGTIHIAPARLRRLLTRLLPAMRLRASVTRLKASCLELLLARSPH
jgi:hypothetical protein